MKPNRPSLYQTWAMMKQRCENPKHTAFDRYGGKGIAVCERWRASFAAFAEDMGPKPSETHTLDRRDNQGNYEPSNCRWATVEEQTANRNAVKGERSPHAKLDEVSAFVIRRVAPLFTKAQLAKWWGVSRMSIARVIDRTTWAHVP